MYQSCQKEVVLNALHEAGAGSIGEYSHCSFSVLGEGRFTPGKTATHNLEKKKCKQSKRRTN